MKKQIIILAHSRCDIITNDADKDEAEKIAADVRKLGRKSIVNFWAKHLWLLLMQSGDSQIKRPDFG